MDKRKKGFRKSIGIILLATSISAWPKLAEAVEWRKSESAHFSVIYAEPHRFFIPGLIAKAERELAKLQGVLGYKPTEKITLIVQDWNDYSSASATTLPRNLIRINISPVSNSGYESFRAPDPFDLLLSHELVHIAMGEATHGAEGNLRRIFGRVMAVSDFPLSLPFSILTNWNRFTPAWQHEGMAVFLETWLNGGIGRGLGNFDEMVFRTLVHENARWLDWRLVDHMEDTFLLGSGTYLYGGRFMHFLAYRHGVDSLLAWIRIRDDDGYTSFEATFRETFGEDLDTAWKAFAVDERAFQQENLQRLRRYPLTEPTALSPARGWVTQPFRDGAGKVLFASFGPHRLASVESLDLRTGELKTLMDLPTPALISIAALAYDERHGRLFYTLNNDRGYRSLWLWDRENDKHTQLGPRSRLGELAVNPRDGTLFAIQVGKGQARLVRSAPPFKQLEPYYQLPPGSQLSHLTISPDGTSLAASLNRDGAQSLILIQLQQSEQNKRLEYTTVSAEGSPAHPCFSPDGKYLYWDAVTNGVANLYRRETRGGDIIALSNIQTGLFHPLPLDDDTLFAFQYTADGFQPVSLPVRGVPGLAAIRYQGQRALARNEQLRLWHQAGASAVPVDVSKDPLADQPYAGMDEMSLVSLLPVVGAYNGQIGIGGFGEMRDPLNERRLYLQAGMSRRRSEVGGTDWHIKLGYAFKNTLHIDFTHQPVSFFDLVNRLPARQRSTIVQTSYKKYWIDEPTKLLTQSMFAAGERWRLGDDDATTNETSLKVGTRLESRAVRKSIGSVSDELGYIWQAGLMRYQGIGATAGKHTSRAEADLTLMHPFLHPHNVGRLQLAVGAVSSQELGLANFYVSGMGRDRLTESTVFRYREPLIFPGLGNDWITARRYLKFSVENSFPPISLEQSWGPFYWNKADINLFHQALRSSINGKTSRQGNIGVQVNFYGTQFYTISTTLSVGIAHAWQDTNPGAELFVRLKFFGK